MLTPIISNRWEGTAYINGEEIGPCLVKADPTCNVDIVSSMLGCDCYVKRLMRWIVTVEVLCKKNLHLGDKFRMSVVNHKHSVIVRQPSNESSINELCEQPVIDDAVAVLESNSKFVIEGDPGGLVAEYIDSLPSLK